MKMHVSECQKEDQPLCKCFKVAASGALVSIFPGPYRIHKACLLKMSLFYLCVICNYVQLVLKDVILSLLKQRVRKKLRYDTELLKVAAVNKALLSLGEHSYYVLCDYLAQVNGIS